jgi:hypothetical protein
MNLAAIQPGRTYRSPAGTRTVLGFTDSRGRKGAQDGVRYRVDDGRGSGREYTMTTRAFARWATEEVTPETVAEEQRDGAAADLPPAA